MTSGAYPKLHQRKAIRNACIYADRLSGMTYVEIGKKHGITPQRAMVIVKLEYCRRLECEARMEALV